MPSSSVQFMGVIEEVGSEVKNFKKGDRVVACFDLGCGHCTCVLSTAASMPDSSIRLLPVHGGLLRETCLAMQHVCCSASVLLICLLIGCLTADVCAAGTAIRGCTQPAT